MGKERNTSSISRAIFELGELAALFRTQQADARTRTLKLTKLEERILLNAAPVDAAAIVPEPEMVQTSVVTPEGETDAVDAGPSYTVPEAEPPSAANSTQNPTEDFGWNQAPAEEMRHEVVFLDRSVDGWQQLLNDLWSNQSDERELDVVLLSSSRDGISQISDALATRTDVDAIHIISHGTDAAIQLGSTTLTNDNFGQYAGEFAAWGAALADDADLLLYGCDLASTDSGRSLVEKLGTLCDCDVAASMDVTGHVDLDGDWDLEFVDGEIETSLAVSDDLIATWYGTLDITSNLFAHYEFEENGGAIATDSTANNNDGSLTNEPTWSNDAAVGNFSLDFTGDSTNNNAVVTVPDDSSLDFGTDMTVAFWYNASVAQNGSTRIIGTHDGSDGFSIFADSGGTLNWFLDDGNDTVTVRAAGGFIADGDWHHVAVTRNGSTNAARIYIDGTLQFNGSVPTINIVNSTAPLTIGGENSFISDYEGLLDDVRAYDRALTQGDIDELVALANTPSTITVTTTNDTVDGDTTNVAALLASRGADGFVSLREAILAVNNDSAGHTIQLAAGTYALTAGAGDSAGDLDIRQSVTITGAGAASTIINANAGDRVIHALGGTITLQDLTITDGVGNGAGVNIASGVTTNLERVIVDDNTASSVSGGGIRNDGTLVMNDVVVSNNNANSASGGGLHNSGNAVISNSLFVGNSASSGSGGAIHNTVSGTIVLTNVTISGNSASAGGPGGLNNAGVGSLTNVTITDNSNGGFNSSNGAFAVNNSIIAGNTGGDASGSFVDGGSNIIGTTTGLNLGSLADNGGFSQTHALLTGSVAINTGTNSGAPSDDQRGVTRDGSIDIGAYEYVAPASTITVNTTSDVLSGDADTSSLTALIVTPGSDGVISLREAITAANNTAGSNTINFEIAAALDGDGLHRITLASALPVISDAVIIDATTDSDFSSTPIIVLDGSDTVDDGFELAFDSDGSTIRGFIIQNFAANGIQINGGSDGHTIVGNWIGSLDADGDNAGAGLKNVGYGIYVGGSGNTIGGTTTADRNVISGNFRGITIDGAGATSNWVVGNYIGSTSNGLFAIGNDDEGISIEAGASNNTIGTNADGTNDLLEGNIIVASGDNGIQLWGGSVTGNRISGNFIGVNSTGIDPLGNATQGIQIGGGANDNVVGGTETNAGNVIGGNGNSGVELIGGGTASNQVFGNWIGTDRTETYDLGHGFFGVYLRDGASDNTIGGTGTGEGNVISYGGQAGVLITGSGTTRNPVVGNAIYGNHQIGIDLGATTADGVTPNDSGDTDGGGNNLTNSAVINSASIANNGTFTLNVDTTALVGGPYSLDLYLSDDLTYSGTADSDQAQGGRYLATLSGVSVGNPALGLVLPGITATPGEVLTIVTRDGSGNTSEFSNAVVLTDADAGGSTPSGLQVVQSNDGGLSINEDGGNDTYLKADNGGAIVGGLTDFTLEARLTLGAAPPSFPHIIDYAVPGQDRELSLLLSGDTVRVTIGNNSVGFAGTYPELRDGDPHTITVTKSNAGVLKLYIDGDYKTELTGVNAGHTIASGGELVVGNDLDDSEGFSASQYVEGTLHDIRIFSDVRSDLEIAASYDSQLPYTEANMVANWRFDQLSIDGVVTESVAGNNLTVKHTAENGFSASEPELSLSIADDVANGTVVGVVAGRDVERDARITTLLAANPTLVYDAQTDKFYQLAESDLTWSQADVNARATTLDGVAGRLATIRSAHEQEVIAEIAAANTGLTNRAWLGGSDSTVEGDWFWQDDLGDADAFWTGDSAGAAVGGAFTNFQTGQPNNNNGNEHYLAIRTDGDWIDDNGTFTLWSIIEWDADAVLDATQPLTYSIQSQSVSGAFAIDSDSGQITVANASSLDVSTLANHTVTVRAADVDGNIRDQAFTIAVTGDLTPTNIEVAQTTNGGLEINTDGGNDVYLHATDASFLSGSRISMEFQISDLQNTGSAATLYSNVSGTGGSEFRILSDGRLSFAGANSTVATPGLFGAGDHSVAFTFNGSTGALRFYIDGQFIEQVTGPIGTFSGGTFVIGQDQDTLGGPFDANETFNGVLRDVRVFNDIRSDIEIGASHQGDIPHDEPNLVANWKFNQLSSDGVVTESVAGNNLTVRHTADSGFSSSVPGLQLRVEENVSDGTLVGAVSGTDAERDALVTTLLADDATLSYSSTTGKFYKVITAGTNWATAQTDAIAAMLNGVNGQLAAVRSADEFEFVRTIGQSAGASGVWLGAADSATEGEWRWYDGLIPADQFSDATGGSVGGSYAAFGALEPSGGAVENHLEFDLGAGQWNDLDGTSSRAYVIEWDADEVLDATQSLAYSIQSQTVAGAFAINADTGVITVANGSLLDHETNATHTLTVRVTDVGGHTYDKALTIAIDDIAESGDAPDDLSTGVTINTGGGNDVYLEAQAGLSSQLNLTDLTLEFVFEVDEPNATTNSLFSYSRGIYHNELYVTIDNAGKVWFGVNSIGLGELVSAGSYPELLDGEQHHLAISWNGTTGEVYLYIDGAVAEGPLTYQAGRSVTSGGTLQLGQDQDLTGYEADQAFRGTLHDVRVWRTVRSASEIGDNYAHHFDSSNIPTGLLANWQFKSLAGGTTIADLVNPGVGDLTVGHVGATTGFTTGTATTAVRVRENAPNGTAVTGLRPTDAVVADPSDFSYAFTAGGDAGGAFAIDTSTGQITVANSTLLDYETTTSLDVTVRVTEAGVGSYTETFTIEILDVVESVAHSLPSPQTTTQDTPLTFSSGGGNAITVDDGSTATDTRLQVWLGVQGFNGTIMLSQTTGLSFPGGANGTSSMVLWGTEADINAALEGAVFTPDAGYTGPANINIETKLAADLQGHYRFQDAGNIGADSSVGVSQTGTGRGDATVVVDGTRGNVLDLSGAGDIEIASDFNQTQEVTIAAWVNIDAAAATGAVINVGGDLALRVEGSGGWGVLGTYNDGSVWQTTISNQMIGGTGWRHIAYVVDGSNDEQRLYIDGSLVAQTFYANEIQDVSAAAFSYVGSNGGTTYVEGRIDDARIYTRALSDDDIATLAADGADVSGTITLTVNDINDAPSFDVASQSVTTDITSEDDVLRSIFLNSDGSFFTIGSSFGTISVGDFIVNRHRADGSLDTSFGVDGSVVTDVTGVRDVMTDAVVQPDGKIVVVGYEQSSNDLLLVRYNTDGTLDSSFGTGGISRTAYTGSSPWIHDLELQADGKLVVGAETQYGGGGDVFTLIRFNSDGSLDATFGSSGFSTTNLGFSGQTISKVEQLPDGKLVSIGYNFNSGAFHPVLLRHNADGSLDTTFGASGSVATPTGGSSWLLRTGMVQSDGKIVGVGVSGSGVGADLLVVRHNADGTLDTSFNGTGVVETAIGSSEEQAYAVVQQPDGKLVVGGHSHNGSNQDYLVVRYNIDGSLDTGFGSGGSLTYDFGGQDYVQDIVVQPAGEILVVGRTTNGDSKVLRLDADGQIDTDFGAISTLNATPTFVEDGAAIVLDSSVAMRDEELDSLNGGDGNYGGASLTVVRDTGANAEDQFNFVDGNGILRSGNSLVKNGQTIATFDTTTTPGQLVVSFIDTNGEIPTTADVGNILSQLTYANASDTPSASVQIDWTFSDGNTGSQGSGGALQDQGSTVVTIVASNDAATIAANNVLTVSEGSTGNVIGTSLLNEGDPDDDGAGLVYRLNTEVTNGTLRRLGVALVSGNTFTQEDIDLNRITYDHDGSNTTTDSFDFSLNDGGEDGTMPVSGTFNISITAINDAPVITSGPGGGTYNEGGSGTYFNNGLTLADADSADFDGGTITVTITAAGEADDRLVVRDGNNVSMSGSNVQYDFGSGPITIGTVAGGTGLTPLVVTFDANATLASVEAVAQQIAFRSVSDKPSTTQRELSMVVTDGDGGTSNTANRVMNVVAVNDTPTLGNLAGSTVNFTEGGPPVVLDSDVQILDAELNALDSFGGSTLTLERSGGANADDVFSATGTITAFIEGNDIVMSGVTIGALDTNSGGTLLVSFYNDATGNLVNEFVRQLAYSNASATPPGNVQIDWTFDDGNAGAQGIGTAGSVTGSTSITINSTNTPPALTGFGDAVGVTPEDTEVEINIAALLAAGNEADVDGSVASFRVTSIASGTLRLGADAASATAFASGTNEHIDAATRAYWTPAADANGILGAFNVVAVDDLSAESTTPVVASVIVTAVNDAPTITAIGDQTINEDGSTGSLNFTVGDVESAAGSLTITATSSNTTIIPNGNLILVDLGGGNWTIEAAPAANLTGGPVTITVTVDDGATTTDETFAVTVSAANDTPVITTIANQAISEDGSTGPLAFSVNDIETDVDSLIVTATSDDQALIPNGNLTLVDLGGGNWTIEATPVANQHGGPATITVTVDDGIASAQSTFTVTVAAVNDAPTAAVLSNATVNENAANGTVVGRLSAIDVDAGDTHQFALLDDANARFTVDQTTGIVTVADSSGLNFEQAASHQITIRVTDGSGASHTETFTVSVTDLNESPIGQDLQFTTTQVGEIRLDTPGLLASATDEDGDALSVRLVAGVSGGQLAFNTDGSFTYTPDPLFEGTDSFSYRLSDGVNESDPITVSIDVEAIAPAPPSEPEIEPPDETPDDTNEDDTNDDSPLDEDSDAELDEEAESEDENDGSSTDSASGEASSPTTAQPEGPATADAPTVDIDPETFNAAAGKASADQLIGHHEMQTSVRFGNQDRSVDDGGGNSLRGSGELPYRNFRRTFIENPISEIPLSIDVNHVQQAIEDAPTNNIVNRELVIGTTKVVSTSLTVGYVVWMVRGGTLAASLVASLPAWTSFDPLAIVSGADLDAGFDDGESLSDLVNGDETEPDHPA